MSEAQKTERFNMFMTPGEMKAIEDWASENRIRSLSEAVRRLCKLGMESGRARTSSEMLSIAINQPSPYSREDMNCMNTRLGDQFLKV